MHGVGIFAQLAMQLIDVAAGFFAGLFMLRFILQWTRAPFRNPVGRFVVTLTDWGVVPLRRVIPGFRGMDLASLVMAWLVQLAGTLLVLIVFGAQLSGDLVVPAILGAFIETLRTACYLIIGVTLAVVILSWVNPYAPLAPVFNAVGEPFLRPFRRLIPPIAGLDLSPLFLLLAMQLLLSLLASLKAAALGFAF